MKLKESLNLPKKVLSSCRQHKAQHPVLAGLANVDGSFVEAQSDSPWISQTIQSQRPDELSFQIYHKDAPFGTLQGGLSEGPTIREIEGIYIIIK